MVHQTTIYFICPNNKFVTGGVKQILRQSQALKEAGYRTSVLIKNNKMKGNWFETPIETKYNPYFFKFVKYLTQKKKLSFFNKLLLKYLRLISHPVKATDILVVPEIYGPKFHIIYPNTNFVVFNQNCYYTFNLYGIKGSLKNLPYDSPKFLANIVASNDGFEYLRYTFPDKQTHKITLGIDEKHFSFAPGKQKKICYMPRKLSDDVNQVINILKIRGLPDGWELVEIDNRSEREVAEIMKKSLIFLSFNHREGFGLPPVEAMACGCYVIGYAGRGGEEYFNPNYSKVITEGDIIGFVKQILDVVTKAENDISEIIAMGKTASIEILNRYNINQEKKDTYEIWKKIYQLHLTRLDGTIPGAVS